MPRLLLGCIEEVDAIDRVFSGFRASHPQMVRDCYAFLDRTDARLLENLRAIERRYPLAIKWLIDSLGVWFPMEYYQQIPVIYPYIVRDPTCRQNRKGRPERYCSPNEAALMRADNTPIKQLVEGRRVVSAAEWYRGQMRRGFVASHAWRVPSDFAQSRVLASRDPWLNTFGAHLCWLPATMSRLTDSEGSFAQVYLQKMARKFFAGVRFEDTRLTDFINGLVWRNLPDNKLPVDVDIAEYNEVAKFEMRPDDALMRYKDLHEVINVLNNAVNGVDLTRAAVHHRYTGVALRETSSSLAMNNLRERLESYLSLLPQCDCVIRNARI